METEIVFYHQKDFLSSFFCKMDFFPFLAQKNVKTFCLKSNVYKKEVIFNSKSALYQNRFFDSKMSFILQFVLKESYVYHVSLLFFCNFRPLSRICISMFPFKAKSCFNNPNWNCQCQSPQTAVTSVTCPIGRFYTIY